MQKPIEIANRVATLLSRDEDDDRILADVCKFLAKSLRAEVISIYIDESSHCRLIANHGFPKDRIGKLKIGKGLGLTYHILETGRPLCLREATTHHAFYYVRGLGEERFHGFAGVPIRRKKSVVGILVAQYRRPHDTNLDEVALLETIAQQISDVVHSKIAREPEKKERVIQLQGRGVVSGIFVGKLNRVLLIEDSFQAQEAGLGLGYKIERKRLDLARGKTIDFFEKLRAETTASEAKEILSTHLTMLSDPSLLKKEESYLKKDFSAEQAVIMSMRDIARTFENISDPYIRQRSVDVYDIGRRLYRTLSRSEREESVEKERGVYLVKNPSPSTIIEGGTKRFGALLLMDESIYSHAIILARSLGIPTIVITADQAEIFQDVKSVMVDGERGHIQLDPTPVIIESYMSSHVVQIDLPREDLGACTTKDGQDIQLCMNAAFPTEVANLPVWVKEIGLYRTEFQYFLTPQIPSEEQQTRDYAEIYRAVGDRPVTLRILDIGGDKCPPSMHFAHEDNPIMGDRSIRYLLRRSDILFTQLRAMLRAQARTRGKLRVLIPMVSVYEEVSRIRDHLIKVIRDLRKEGIRAKVPPLGVMIEIPSCVQLIPKLGKLADFFCVGTNDLLQYYMACDRNNHSVNHLYRWHHPPFLMALADIAQKCENVSTDVSICGEMAGELWGSLVLIGLGYQNLSMDKRTLAVHHRLISQCQTGRLQRLIKKLLECETSLEALETMQIFLEHWTQLDAHLRELLDSELTEMLNPVRSN